MRKDRAFAAWAAWVMLLLTAHGWASPRVDERTPAPFPAFETIPALATPDWRYHAHSILRALNLPVHGTCVEGVCWNGLRVHLCFAPGTPQWYVDAVSRRLFGEFQPGYNLFARWTWTSYGSTDTIGTPIRLRWSFVPDGLSIIDHNMNVRPSSLFATMDAQFGNRALWQNLFRESFARWSQLAGVRYQEVSDDGAQFPFTPGSATRGDVRIGACYLDGSGGILAFNLLPDIGDMVLDISENWAQPADNYRYLRNTIMHEHGHGLGLGHVIPTDCTKLMEPLICTNFDGPQDDDIRGAQRLYGDPNEPNNGYANATPISLIVHEQYTVANVSLHSTQDSDWYHITLPPNISLNITLTPVGGTYLVGPQFGNPVQIDTRAMQNLDMELRAADGTTILRLAAANGRGGAEQIRDYRLPGGGVVYLRVYSGSNSLNDVQRYELRLQRALLGPASFTPLGFLSNRRESRALGVSTNGVVVGWARNANNQQRAFRWTIDTGMQDLGTLGGSHSAAIDVSSDGSVVVGWAYNARAEERAFRWTALGGMQDLGTRPGFCCSDAYGVSADGSVVVGRVPIGAFTYVAFRWTRTGGMQDLGTLGGDWSEAFGVSADGSVVVGWARNASGQRRAFRWSEATGSVQDLGTLGGSASEAHDTSADGSVVVGVSRDSSGRDRAFRWTEQSGMQDLGAFHPNMWSKAFAVSWDGRIVVGTSQYPAGAIHAFVWTPEAGVRDLNVLFRHVIPHGWELVEATDISPDGRYIVGWGLNPANEVEAFLLDTGGELQRYQRLPGDANGDCQVDDADLLMVLFAFGGSDPNADLNGDGTVDDADLLEVLFNFGRQC